MTEHSHTSDSYALIQKRLQTQGKTLAERVATLNQTREQTFGKTTSAVIARINVRSENNCVPRDIVRVGEQVLFGYNVFIGMKAATQIGDVFALYHFSGAGEQIALEATDLSQSFLADKRFQADFSELYSYYKNTKLTHLRVTHHKLLAVFQIGDNSSDIRVFRWQIEQNGQVNYIDNRGERDVDLPPAYDFEWQSAERQHQVSGRQTPKISLFDEVFIEVNGGQLLFRIEDNTPLGETVHQESVEDAHQSLDDLQVQFARIGTLVVIRITPYNEKTTRGYIFDTRTQRITRVDALNTACVQLPEDHGIIFPGGYYLTGGDYKLYADDIDGLKFKRRLNAPNGEDVLFVFYEQREGRFALYSYNLIKKQLETPIFAHGYSLFPDGRLLIFRAENDDPTRIHPMQLWQTPYVSEEFHAVQPVDEGFFTTIGNAELVRAIAELNAVSRLIDKQEPTTTAYQDLIKSVQKLRDSYHWLADAEAGQLDQPLAEIADTAELVLLEFEKVNNARRRADNAIAEARQAFTDSAKRIALDDYHTPQPFVDGLLALKRQTGHLVTLRDNRYIDTAALDTLNDDINTAIENLGRRAVTFLSADNALASIIAAVQGHYDAVSEVKTVSELAPIITALAEQAEGLDALTDVINSLRIDDSTQKTAILEAVSQVYSRINQAKAHARLTRKNLSASESVAEFGAQLAVLSQSVSAALANVETPDDCNEQLSRLLVQVEELAAAFSEHEDFLADIFAKRDEIVSAFEEQKQRLSDEQQRRAQNLYSAASRILDSVKRRSLQFQHQDALNTYFSADTMVLKIAELSQQLHDLGDSVKADDIDARFNHLREQAIRSLRDKSEIFEDDGHVIKLGKHRFNVNQQKPDFTLLPRDGEQVFHIIGTDFYQTADNTELLNLRDFWQQTVVAETPDIYRSEYLAYAVFAAAEQAADDSGAVADDVLHDLVKHYADENYRDGYEKGVHDHDAIKILQALLPVYRCAGLLRFAPPARALAWLFIHDLPPAKRLPLRQRARAAVALRQQLHNAAPAQALADELQAQILAWVSTAVPDSQLQAHSDMAAAYLLEAVAETSTQNALNFAVSDSAQRLQTRLQDSLSRHGQTQILAEALAAQPLLAAYESVYEWLRAVAENTAEQHVLAEAAAHWLLQQQLQSDKTPINHGAALNFTVVNHDLSASASDLLGEHRRIQQRTLTLSLDDFFVRLSTYIKYHKKQFEHYVNIRQQVIEQARESIDLSALSAEPLSTFVRNKLINDSYLNLIGDNLAKQMGALGADKRSDLMGLLLLISPPGYGKTTLMEYVANRLGLNFMKINCPSLGHDVKSLDPATTNSATARQELERLNLALEMGNNVMLYLDDIQHTHPEFLQKFISLCDGSRRIDGVWQGNSKTYYLRGKKFCIIMAGNPYTESGEVFKIPDMLANRADVYNLGDILSGQKSIFELSYLENALTSNPTLAPLALRDQADVYRFIAAAEGKDLDNADFSYDYSAAEREDIIAVLQKLMRVRDVVLKVNQAYIQSAAMDDRYREAPAFKLQGSYRNMNKLAEKVVPLMDDSELTDLINDHYLSEAQLLTTGAEENILAFKALNGLLNNEEQQRHAEIIAEFKARNAVAGDDPSTRIAQQIARLNDGLETHLSDALTALNNNHRAGQHIGQSLQQLNKNLEQSLNNLPQQLNAGNSVGLAISNLAEMLQTQLKQLQQQVSRQNQLNNELTRIEQALAGLKTSARQQQTTLAELGQLDEKIDKVRETVKSGLKPIANAMQKEIGIDEAMLARITEVYKALQQLGKR